MFPPVPPVPPAPPAAVLELLERLVVPGFSVFEEQLTMARVPKPRLTRGIHAVRMCGA